MKPKVPTLEQLKTMTPERRMNLYNNAKKRGDELGRQTCQLIEESGLPMSSGGLRADDPLFAEIQRIIFSVEGRAAARAAAAAGLPALCGVDPLLRAKLGDRYGPHDMGTNSAGRIVADLMGSLGYSKNGTASCPSDCTARSGVVWK